MAFARIQAVRASGRRFASSVAAHEQAEEKTAAAAKVTWKRVSYFVALPACALIAANVIVQETKHKEHREHQHHAGEEQKPHEFGTYINVRNKPYPWGNGNKTLFWNDHVNKIAAGDEEHEGEHSVAAPALTQFIASLFEKDEERIARRRKHLAEMEARCNEFKRLHSDAGKFMPAVHDTRKDARRSTLQVQVHQHAQEQ